MLLAAEEKSERPVANIIPCQISRPLYLSAGTANAAAQMISLREHLPSTKQTSTSTLAESTDNEADNGLPLVLLTLHPGYSAGSYENRDYFELVTPLLFRACAGKLRLRVFTVNHPGHDLPPKSRIHRFRTEQYSIDKQPAMIVPALRWLLQREIVDEDPVHVVAYGHSMGGLALAQSDLDRLVEDMAQRGRRIRIKKVLSAPALFLSRQAKRTLPSLEALNALKHTLGRLPIYERLATGLFRGLAPPIHKLSAKTFSLNYDDGFLNFRRQNPFLLLQQARELLQFKPDPQQLPKLLDGTHLFVFSDDRMVDNPALLRAAGQAQQQGAAVNVHLIKSMHSAERENPHAVAQHLRGIIQDFLAA